MLSMGVALLLIEAFVGSSQVTPKMYPQFLQSVRTALMIFSILCGVGVFASLARGNLGRR
jgi:hypothetical protein